MKIVVTTDDGTEIEYEGDAAENMMFFAGIGADLFHTLTVTCVLKDSYASLTEYIKGACTSDSFRDMFLRAVAFDDVDHWNALVEVHYGGRQGLVNLSQELADKMRERMKDKVDA